MARDSKVPDKPAVDAALRKVFKAVESQPVPAPIVDTVETLAAPVRRPDTRS